MQNERMVGKNRLCFAEEPLRVRIAALGHKTLDGCHERRHLLFIGGSARLYRTYIHG
jgi:hypothetical protein